MGLGKKRVAKLKQELVDLIDQVPDIAAANLDQFVIWMPEKGEDRPGYYYEESEATRESLNKAVRYIVGEAGRLLNEYEYSVSDYELWHSDKKWRYRYGFDWPEEMHLIHERYNKEYRTYRDALHAVEKLSFEKERSQAKHLWDSV